MPDGNSQTISLKRQVVPEYAARPMTDVPQPKEKYPTEIIPLPTKGWFYPEGHLLSSGEIEVKQVTAKEEDILANQELIKKGTVLDKLMESVVVNKGINIDEILLPDRNAMLIAIRRLAYGDNYNVTISCPQCNAKNLANIDLSKLEYKEFDFDSHPRGKNEFVCKLPSGISITYKLLNKVDEKSMDAEISHFKKISKGAPVGELTTRLKYLITSIDGNVDKIAIRNFVDERFTAKDSFAFRKHMREKNPDIDDSIDFVCSECGYERRMDMPLGASFLWPDIES